MANASIAGAGGNVRINLTFIEDVKVTAPLAKDLKGIEKEASYSALEFRKILKERSNLTFF